MRRLWVFLIVVGLSLAGALSAGAAKPDCDDDPPHPRCKDSDPEPSDANTCVSPWWADDIVSNRDNAERTFTITLNGTNSDTCVDVLSEYEGRWFVTVGLVAGNLPRGLTIVPRDGVAPGDSCGGVMLRGKSVDLQKPIPLPYFEDLNGNGVQDPGEEGDTRFDTIPASTVNACRGNAPVGEPGEFDETLEWASSVTDKNSFEDVLNSWGSVAETEFNVMEARPQIHPLTLQVFSSLKRGDEILLTVTLPGPPQP